MISMFHSLSNGEGRVWDPDDVPAEAVDGVGVHVVDPLVGGLPDDDPDPEREVGGHQVDEPEPGEQPEPLHDHGRVDEQEVHLEEGEQSLDLIFYQVFQSYIYCAPLTCSMGWAMTMLSTQSVLFMVACIAISRPMKIRVPRPNTARKLLLI